MCKEIFESVSVPSRIQTYVQFTIRKRDVSKYIGLVANDSFVWIYSPVIRPCPCALHYQAAADFAKAHLPEALRQQLLTYEREKERDREKDKEKDEKRERGGHSYPSILEQQILTLDREMLDKLSAAYNEAGWCVFDT